MDVVVSRRRLKDGKSIHPGGWVQLVDALGVEGASLLINNHEGGTLYYKVRK